MEIENINECQRIQNIASIGLCSIASISALRVGFVGFEYIGHKRDSGQVRAFIMRIVSPHLAQRPVLACINTLCGCSPSMPRLRCRCHGLSGERHVPIDWLHR
mgnify:CR=1 FL=1